MTRCSGHARPAGQNHLARTLISIVSALLMAGSAWSQSAAEMTFSPQQPTPLDPIRVVVTGVWSTTCAPELFDLIVDGDTLRVELAEDVVLPCESVPTEYSVEAEFSPQPAGDYQLQLIYWGPFASTQLDEQMLEVSAVDSPSLRTLSVHPSAPLTTDRIQVVASGIWADGCVPELSQVEVEEDEVVVTTLTSGEICVQATTAYDVATTIGPLPAGTYELVVLVADELGLPAEQTPVLGSRSFTVRGGAATTAVLDGRFEVAVSYEDKGGVPGTARVMTGALPSDSEVVSGSGETALFWFFSPDNTEMLVKVLDGCAINDRFWVFASAATDLAFTLTVTDLHTAEVRSYENFDGQPAVAINDTDAFATCSP